MKREKTLPKRYLAIVLALALVVSSIGLDVRTVNATPSDTIAVTEGQIVANNYVLTDSEKALISSGLLVGDTQEFSKPTDNDELISVDTENKKISVSDYEDSVSGKTWTPVSVKLVYSDGEEKLELSGDVYPYTYDGTAFSVEATYEVKTTVALDVQEKMLSAAKYLKEGKAELDSIYYNRGNLSSYHTANEYLVQLAEGITVGTGFTAQTLQFKSQEAIDSAKALNEQMGSNNDKLLAFTMASTYNSSDSKTEYLVTSGKELHDTVAETYIHINNVMNDEVFELLADPDSTLSQGIILQDEALYNALMDLFVPSMETWLYQMSTNVVKNGTWPDGQAANFLKTGMESADYATLDTLAADLGQISTVEAVEELVAATATVKLNMSMSNVTVSVIWNTVNENNEVATYKEATSATPITLADGTTKAEILEAIEAAGEEAKVVSDWALDKANYEATYSTLPDTLDGDVTYVITYNPKEYTVSGDDTVKGDYPYGHKLTLPKHAESPTKVYDYTVGGEYYPEGAEYVISGDVEITRVEGAARDTKTLLEIVLKDTLTSDERTILGSEAVKVGNSLISIRYPSDSKVTLDEIAGVVTAEKVLSDYPAEELYWIPTEAIVANGTATTNYEMTEGANGYTATITESDYDSVTVVYTLELNDFDAGAVKNMPHVLVTEAADQLDKMEMLVAEETSMADVAYDILEMLKKYATGETLTQLNNILNKCYTKDQTKLDLYHYIVEYKGIATEAEQLVYYYKNRDVMNEQLEILVDALKVIKDDEAFKQTCIDKLGNQASDAFGKLESVEDKLDKIVLPAPNAVIVLDSSSLLTLAEVLVNPETVVEEHASELLVLSHNIIKQASGRVTITVNMTQGANKATFSLTFKKGQKPDQAAFETEYNKAYAIMNIADANKAYYTDNSAKVAEILDTAYAESTSIDLVWTAIEYSVVIDDVDYGKVSINNSTIVLPVHEKTADGIEYVYNVAGVEYAQGATVSVSLEDVKNEKLEITREEKDVKAEAAKEKFEKFEEEINKASDDTVKFEVVEEQDGSKTLTMEVTENTTQGVLAAITTFVQTLANQPYKVVALNDEVFYESASISLQTLVNAFLKDENFNNESVVSALLNGTPLITGKMQLCSANPAARSTGLAIEEELDFVMKITGDKSQLTSLADALEILSPYVTFQANEGILDIDVDLPEKVYEVYLTALIAAGQVDISDINAVNTAIATMFVEDYVKGIIGNDDITTTTFQNTLEILDAEVKDKLPNYNLTQYERRYQQLRTILNEWTDINESNGAPKADVSVPAKQAIDRAIALTGANIDEGLLDQIKEYNEEDGRIEATAVVTIVNTTEDFEALVMDLNALKEGAKDLKEGVTRDKLVALVKGQGIANAVDYTDDLAGRMESVTGAAAIILLEDIESDLTFDTTIAIDLNGKTITGDITSNKKLYIFNSTIGDNAPGGIDGAISGNVAITGGTYTADVTDFLPEGYKVVDGVVQNTLYTVDVSDGNVNFIVNSDMIDEEIDSYVSYAKALAAEIALDVAMNFYPYAMLTANGHNVYEFAYEDYMGLLADTNTAGEAVDLALECISLPGMAEFMNDVMADLLDFAGIQTALENKEIVASYSLKTAPWELVVKHDTEGDFITGGLVADQDKVAERNITLKFVGNNSATTSKFFGLLDEIVSEAEVRFVNVEDLTFDNKHFNLTGGLEAKVTADMSDYTTYMAIVLANALEGDAKAAMVDAVNNGDEDALKDAFDAIVVKDVATALKVLKRGDTFEALAEAVGINTTIDLSKNQKLLEKAMMYTLAAAGRALEELDVTGTGHMLGNLDKDDDGVYDFAKAITRSATVTRRGYGANFELTTADADVTVRLFGEEPVECLWGDADHDGDVDAHDASLVLQYTVGLSIEGTFCTTRTDVDQDGDIDAHDASLILQYTVGNITTLPVDKN